MLAIDLYLNPYFFLFWNQANGIHPSVDDGLCMGSISDSVIGIMRLQVCVELGE